MALVSQEENGRWWITVSHEVSGLRMKATFTYGGIDVHLVILDTPQTFRTEWYTEPGECINLDDITRVYSPTIYQGKKYIVSDDCFEILAYSDLRAEIDYVAGRERTWLIVDAIAFKGGGDDIQDDFIANYTEGHDSRNWTT